MVGRSSPASAHGVLEVTDVTAEFPNVLRDTDVLVHREHYSNCLHREHNYPDKRAAAARLELREGLAPETQRKHTADHNRAGELQRLRLARDGLGPVSWEVQENSYRQLDPPLGSRLACALQYLALQCGGRRRGRCQRLVRSRAPVPASGWPRAQGQEGRKEKD